MNAFSDAKKNTLRQLHFHERIAYFLNYFFGTALNGLDCEFAIGRHPIRMIEIGHKCIIAECFRNLENDYDYMLHKLSRCIRRDVPVTEWIHLAVRIALLWGLLGGADIGAECVDVAVSDDDDIALLSAVYAKQMGLPIGNMILCCRENAPLWQLIHKGSIRTGDCPNRAIERLMFFYGGTHEVQRYLDAVCDGGVYAPTDRTASRLKNAIVVRVVGKARASSAIGAFAASDRYVPEPSVGRCYCALMDYRAVSGQSRAAMIVSLRRGE